MRPDAYGIVTAYGSPHLARKAEQVPQGLRDTGSSKRTCTLCSNYSFRFRSSHSDSLLIFSISYSLKMDPICASNSSGATVP